MDPMDIQIRYLDINLVYKQGSLIWYFTKSGRYSVKSRYWLSQALDIGLKDSYVSEPSLNALKAHVWN